MRIVALEEHFTVPSAVRKIDPAAIKKRGFPTPQGMGPDKLLADIGAGRIADMDATGVTVQVLSVSGPGAELVDGAEGVSVAREMNDVLAAAIKAHPGRLAGFAHLPLRSPEAAADELERCIRDLGFCGVLVNGMIDDRFLDDARFEPVLARAEALDAPLYLHPSLPPEAVRKAYYEGLPGNSGFALSIAGWGWHSETAIHLLRLVLSGALDRHPKLKVIIGHMGEGLPAMLVRTDGVLSRDTPHLKRRVGQAILDQVWVTTSGLFTRPPLDVLLAVFGIDRVMFSIDYPFSANKLGKDFLESLQMPAGDLEKLAHGNADRLLKLGAAS